MDNNELNNYYNNVNNQSSNYSQNYNQNYNPNYNQNYNPNYNPNQNYNQSYNTNLNNANNKPPKKRSGCLVSLLKVILVFFIILGIIVGAVVYGIYKGKQKEIAEVEKNLIVVDESDEINQRIEALKVIESDITGMSQYDKINMGLLPYNNSDSDGDGLTDKEEIEVYGSNPLLVSTAGDGIPDGYKIKNDLAVNKKYNSTDIGYSSFSNITIKSLNHSVAVISEIEGYSMNGVPSEIVYSISNYDGELKIDFSEYILENKEYLIFKKNDESNSEYEILKDKNGVVNFKTNGKDCVVGFVNINKSTTFDGLFDVEAPIDEMNTIEGNDSILICFPIMVLTGEAKFIIFEKSIVDKESTKSEILTEFFNNEFGEEAGFTFNVEHKYLNIVSYKTLSKVLNYVSSGAAFKKLLEDSDMSVSDEDISTFKNILSFFVVVLEIEADEWKELANQKSESPSEDVKGEKVSKYVSGFDVSKDALPFPNFGTYISEGGNCAGFALITTQLFNEYLYPEKATSIFKDISYSYDISNKEYYSTFFDIHLNDYKDYSYWTTTYPDMEHLQRSEFLEEDRNFLDFIGYKWAEGNDIDKGLIWFNNELPWSDFEKVIDFFENNNKILNLSMSSGGSGHAVNAYGLEQDKDNPNIWYILVYDNNFPNHEYKGQPVNNRVKIIRKSSLFGEDYFEFDYYPLPDKAPNYRYTSYATVASHILVTATQAHMFVLTDEYTNTLIGGEK